MAFRFDKLTVKAQEAVQRAHGLAQDRAHQQLTPLHLLAALLKEEQGLVRPVIQKIGANLKQLESIVDGELTRLPKISGADADVSMSPVALKVLEAAQDLAQKMKDQFVSTEHLLIALT